MVALKAMGSSTGDAIGSALTAASPTPLDHADLTSDARLPRAPSTSPMVRHFYSSSTLSLSLSFSGSINTMLLFTPNASIYSLIHT
jgi:hypothetical protein